jgi:hypothetical protein
MVSFLFFLLICRWLTHISCHVRHKRDSLPFTHVTPLLPHWMSRLQRSSLLDIEAATATETSPKSRLEGESSSAGPVMVSYDGPSRHVSPVSVYMASCPHFATDTKPDGYASKECCNRRAVFGDSWKARVGVGMESSRSVLDDHIVSVRL